MISILILTAICSILSNATLNAGGKSKDADGDEIPHYIELGADQGIYNALVGDSGQVIPVTKISFAGDTTLDGVKKEVDNSTSRINLGEIDSMRVVDPIYPSKRYPGSEFCAVIITTTAGISEEMLMPRDLLICGQDRESKIKKTWPLRKIEAIQLEHGIETSGRQNKVQFIAKQ